MIDTLTGGKPVPVEIKIEPKSLALLGCVLVFTVIVFFVAKKLSA